MDAFYASATLLSHPDLVGTPVIIGGGNRGVVLSATYEARRFGVTSTMPMARARRLCPQATVLPPDHALYAAISAAVMETFRSVTPVIEPLSLDEAFLDVSGAVRLLGSPAVIGQHVRDTVHDEQGITCSVGVAPTKFVAKLVVGPGQARRDGGRAPRRGGAVRAAAARGRALGRGGAHRGGAGAPGPAHRRRHRRHPLTTLVRGLGDATGHHLHELAWGRDPRPVEREQREKSIGSDETFDHDIDDAARSPAAAGPQRAHRGPAAGRRPHRAHRHPRVRFSDFTTITRSRTLREPTDSGRAIHEAAVGLYDALGLQRARLRLVGVRLEKLVEAAHAPIQGVIGEPEHGWRDADKAVDRARSRFGSGSVRPASLIQRDTSASAQRPRDLS